MDILLGICIGISLSAACGFRVFVPPLVMSMAALSGHLTLSPGFEWIGTYEALTAFAIATGIEVLGYYIPWVDHVLDLLATPIAIATGTTITASFFSHVDPLLQWSVAIIAGGGSAGIVEALTNITRFVSTGTTGGVANPLLATVELATSIILSVLGIIVPIFTVVLLAVLGVFAGVKLWQILGRSVPTTPTD
ncbi:DUF4126 domain-containing protein [Planktothrix sp. FACHB-1355]|uniref:DUF4126 domain-containing protein n=1 Tax=Aerosakkonema funiforme FACHB-1375 TaxID=2949571 RepID=A0A926ZI99_9CYAN|nr:MULTISPECIES: DUF4126 domain-containing protein [Oscillatoriales]MBD2183022.1 DUF4126 domain-containing protein [Aerosakkonema funiforme FACHB-1375]MBD3559032.1 DUF4126 domain-containing protein [Planktothrix sp. FACHB-1355]